MSSSYLGRRLLLLGDLKWKGLYEERGVSCASFIFRESI